MILFFPLHLLQRSCAWFTMLQATVLARPVALLQTQFAVRHPGSVWKTEQRPHGGRFQLRLWPRGTVASLPPFLAAMWSLRLAKIFILVTYFILSATRPRDLA